MKSMSDRSLGWGKGMPKSEGFFPENPHVQMRPQASKVNGFNYPDTDEQVVAAQNQQVKAANAGKAKTGYRH